MYRNVLIATDGSELAERAVSRALELAKALGAKVTVVTVTDIFPTGQHSLYSRPADIEWYEARVAEAAKEILDRVSEAARELGIICTTQHVADEFPAQGILKACKEHDCDLIVMSTHGRRGLDRLLLGSQTAKVVTSSSVPVLICR